jgi:transposase
LHDTQEQHTKSVTEKITELNQSLPSGEHAVRGRGRFKGKIVKRQRQLNPREVSRYTAQVASRALSNNIDQLVDAGEDVENMLEQLILREMMAGQTKRLPAQRKQRKYKIEEPDEYDYESDGDDY